jgi:hypothetical protein
VAEKEIQPSTHPDTTPAKPATSLSIGSFRYRSDVQTVSRAVASSTIRRPSLFTSQFASLCDDDNENTETTLLVPNKHLDISARQPKTALGRLATMARDTQESSQQSYEGAVKEQDEEENVVLDADDDEDDEEETFRAKRARASPDSSHPGLMTEADQQRRDTLTSDVADDESGMCSEHTHIRDVLLHV